ncbi:hypothetical protein GOP47_0005505 [Adiantum capillus-veneris]|uniref:Uncharacterized protein n=1 Tax=Adiantum capillus-veneris TaxID=13818 RepID=A0A9D4V576_ADICA|nr:hypothetical protein GOP47_0005505 [Adiantum capillus-veneris]
MYKQYLLANKGFTKSQWVVVTSHRRGWKRWLEDTLHREALHQVWLVDTLWDRWTLVLFFNCHLCPITHLPKDKSAILFFESLSLRSLNRYILPVKRVLEHFSAYATQPQLRMELSHPEDCHVQTIVFTKTWFAHEQVEAMKSVFGSWAQESNVDNTSSV